jgi:iron-sulfur cluster assembly accessory protein
MLARFFAWISSARKPRVSASQLSRKSLVSVTQAAAEMMLEIMRKERHPLIRVGAQPIKGAIDGQWIYELETEDQVDPKRDLLSESHGVPLVVDKVSAKVLDGVVIDFVTENGRSGFKFHNPNAK